MHCVALKQHIIESRQGQPNNTSKPRPGSSNSTSITMPEGYEIPIVFNISFIMNSRFFLMHVACATMHEILKTHTLNDPPLSNVARKWLFPEPADLESGPRLLAREHIEPRWIDAGLNNEQRVSVHLPIRQTSLFIKRIHKVCSAFCRTK